MIREFTVGASKTVNLGNYNSLKVEGSITYVLEDGQDYHTQKMVCLHQLKDLLADNYRVQLKQKDTTSEPATSDFPGG